MVNSYETKNTVFYIWCILYGKHCLIVWIIISELLCFFGTMGLKFKDAADASAV